MSGNIKMIFVVAVALLLTACANPNPMVDTVTNPAGFFSGLWHGLTCVIAFIFKLFGADIAIYEVHNNGGWYDFGFILGTYLVFEGSDEAVERAKGKK